METQFNSEASDFRGYVITTAMKHYNAGCGTGEDYGKFMARLWSEYCDAGKPTPRRKWIIERLKGEFVYVDKPPVWVGAEPNWAFYDGRPMVFLHQSGQVPRNAITEKHCGTWNMVLYTFVISVMCKDGFARLVYKLIEEHPDIRGATGVQSNPIWIGGEPESE